MSRTELFDVPDHVRTFEEAMLYIAECLDVFIGDAKAGDMPVVSMRVDWVSAEAADEVARWMEDNLAPALFARSLVEGDPQVLWLGQGDGGQLWIAVADLGAVPTAGAREWRCALKVRRP